MTEEWRPVLGYAGLYEVSDQGRIRSLDRQVHPPNGAAYQIQGRIRATSFNVHGRVQVGLSRDGVLKTRLVHQLVAEAFHGPRPSAASEVRHLNGDHLDNRATNLAWGTQSENNFDRVTHGTHHNAIKERCKRGHLLIAPNLCNYRQTPGQRACKACSWGSDHYRRALRRGENADRQELSDAAYARIMGNEAPTGAGG